MGHVTRTAPVALTRRQMLGFSLAAGSLLAVPACSADKGGGSGADLGKQSAGSMTGFAADKQFTASKPFTLSMLWTDWPDLPVKKSWTFFDEIQKRTKVKLQLTHIPFSDATEKRSLLISAGDAPAVIPLVYTGDEKPFVASGAILPMSDYVQHMPNFRKYVKDWDLQKMIDNLRQSDGKYYMVPGLQEVSVPVFTVIIRKDVFDEVGAGIPQTWDAMRAALVKIKKKYPKSHPLADGFEGQSMLNYAAHAFGTQAGWGFGDGMMGNKAGQLEYTAISPGYKQMVEFFAGLVRDGLLDPESFTSSDSGGGAKSITEKIANNQIFAASGASGTVVEFSQALEQTLGKGKFKMLQIAPPGGPAGQVVEPRNFWHGFMLSSSAKDSENFLATLQFLDWFYYNPDARELLRWGVEGQTYTKSGGKYALKPNYSLDAYNLNPKGKIDIEKDLGFSTFPAEATESRALKESYNSPDFVDYMNSVLKTRTPRDPNPPAPLTEAELEQASLLATPLKDTVDTNTMKFILGDRSLGEWDKYVAQLKSQGLQKYVDLINTARKRFAEKHS